LAEALTVLLAEQELSWDTDGQAVLVADRETLAKFRQLIAARNAKHKNLGVEYRYALIGNRILVNREAKEANTPEKRLTLLDDLLKDISAQAHLPIVGDENFRKNWQKQNAWLPLKNLPVQTALDLIAVAGNADWSITEKEGIHFTGRKSE
jgi:hypothetical protein